MTDRPAPEETGEGGGRRFADLLCLPRRCGAGKRGGGTCERPAVPGRRRCLAHGGRPGSHAPAGNKNRLAHGAYTQEAIAERRRFNALIREGWRAVREIERG